MNPSVSGHRRLRARVGNPVKAESWMMNIPLFSQNMLIGEIIRDQTVPLAWYTMSIASTLMIGLVLAVIAASIYNSPKLIFSSE